MGKYYPVKQYSIFVVAVHGVQNLCITLFVHFSGSVRSRHFDFWSIREQSRAYNFVYCIFFFNSVKKKKEVSWSLYRIF